MNLGPGNYQNSYMVVPTGYLTKDTYKYMYIMFYLNM